MTEVLRNLIFKTLSTRTGGPMTVYQKRILASCHAQFLNIWRQPTVALTSTTWNQCLRRCVENGRLFLAFLPFALTILWQVTVDLISQPRSQGLSSPHPKGREEERPWFRLVICLGDHFIFMGGVPIYQSIVAAAVCYLNRLSGQPWKALFRFRSEDLSYQIHCFQHLKRNWVCKLLKDKTVKL